MTTSSSIHDGDMEQFLECYNEEMSADKMRNALAAIAQEVQRFHNTDTSDELPEEPDVYKSMLQMKRKQIKTLKQSVNTACTIAKTVMSAKEIECRSLSNHLALERNKSENLAKELAKSTEIIQRLNTENHDLTKKIHNLNSFIELGFEELQKIRNQQVNDLPIVMQLKEIMVWCGQYYSDYSNEHEKCIQLEQKNRYLTNKLHILETNLGATAEELRIQRGQNEKSLEKKTDVRKIGYVCSEYKFSSDVNISRASLESKSTRVIQKEKSYKQNNCGSKDFSLDLSTHMSLVKNLLSDQDTMLKELRKLTEELGIVNS